jgi:hypothetical protein
VGEVAEDVLFLQRFHQSTLVLIGNKVPAFAVRADLQGI